MENTSIALHNQRRAILCQAFQDVSDFINTPLKNAGNTTKVKIWIRNQSNTIIASYEKARGSSYHVLPYPAATSPGTQGGITDGEVWRTIHAGKDSYTNVVFPLMNTQNPAGIYHGFLTFNFLDPNTVWNYTYSKYNAATGFAAGNLDFYTQAVHEIMHLLGINSLLGGSTINFSLANGTLNGNYYTRFDKFFKAYPIPSLLNPVITNTPLTAGEMYNFSPQIINELHPGCTLSPPFNNSNSDYANCQTSVMFVGPSITLPLYTPKCLEQFLTFANFEDSCYGAASNDNYFLMSNKENGIIAKRTLTPEERLVLNDIGYSVKGTYGSTSNFTFKNYGVSDSAGIPVGGVNDAFNASGNYIYQGNSGANISLSGFLANDYIGSGAANLKFEFLEDLYDVNATFTARLGDASTNVVYKSYVPGIHILRYVPYDNLSGKRGNITYIAVNVLNNCAISNPCELVKNGDFEQCNLTPYPFPFIMNSCGWQNADYRVTADYFNTALNQASNGVPCNFMGSQSDRIPGNHAYVGGIFSTAMCENIRTELNTALLPNTTYQLKFDVSLAESRSQKSIKFQAFITDTDLQLTSTNGFIASTAITADKVFLSNATFSNAATASPDGWETVTFNFTTSSNTNLKYLYIGGLNNVQIQSETGQAIVCPVSYGAYAGAAYYYIDNISLLKTSTTTIVAINDNFSNMPIISSNGGITTSVYANDLYNGLPSSAASLPNITFSLESPITIAGASINAMGLISIPAGTPSGAYTLTYKLSVLGNCTNTSTATVIILVTTVNTTPTLIAAIRANNIVSSIGLQSSGKSIISGAFTTYNNITQPYLARLKADLTLDQTFPFSGNQKAMDLAIQSDDKIIAATYSAGFGGTSMGITRLLPNGGVDGTFNVGGVGISRNIGYTNDNAYAIAIQPNDGKILLGGDFYYYNGVKRLGIVRIYTNGSIDLSFDPIELNSYYRNYVTGITIQPDGKIILLGLFGPDTSGTNQKSIIRLLANGKIDPIFTAGDTNGSSPYNVLSTSLFSPIAKAVVQPADGSIIIAGAFTKYNSATVNCLVRLTSTGAIDTNFNTLTGVDRGINDLIIEPITNKIIIGGEFTTFGGTPVKKLIRLSTTGTLDPTFSIGAGTTDNIIVPAYQYSYNYVKALKQQPDGKIIVGGKFLTFNGLSATNITRIWGDAGIQAKNGFVEFQSEPEIDSNIASNLVVYPNPSKDVFNIDLSNVTEEFDKITIINLLGEKVFTSSLLSKTNNQLNLSNIPSGYYIATLENSSTNNRKQIKLIKE